MNKIYNYIALTTLAIASIGCIEDINADLSSAKIGDEVQFDLSFDTATTKTIYGPENVETHAFPIYWSDGDVVQVASPQCARKVAEYIVTPESGQNYAKAMTNIGDHGVQWGATETADFYSIYPSNNTSWPTLTENKVVTKLHIDSEQSSNLVFNDNEYIAADMSNVIMYAQTNNVEIGKTVNLKYIPYSTMLEFDMGIAQGLDEQGGLAEDEDGNPVYGTVKIMSMTLTAPTGVGLAGDFNLTFNGESAPTIEKTNNNTNIIAVR